MAGTRDDIGNFAKFVSPTVVGGRVYMASFSGQLAVYGLLPPAAPLPAPWQQEDVGSVGVAGLATFDAKSGTFMVRGAGTNIGGVADAMHLAWFAVTDDVDLSMRVVAQQPTGAAAQAGLMVRELVDPAAREAALVVSPNGTVSLITRAIGGGAAVVDTSAATVTLPLYLRLSRKGATVTGSFSADGVAWTQVASHSLPMGAAIDVGLVANGASALSTSTATFDQMALH
jgi:regulation of enolase protein 1 (concanavalin A-like superfamily)